MTLQTLRVGIIVDGDEVPAWIAALLQSVEKSTAAHIVRVERAHSFAHPQEKGSRFYPRIDRSLFPIREDALQQVPLSTALDRVPQNNPGNPVDLVLHLSRTPPSEKGAPFGT